MVKTFILCVCGRGEDGNHSLIVSHRRWLPVSRLSVKRCVKSDLSPDPTHLVAIPFPSFLIRGGKSRSQCSHFFDMELSPACLSGHATADAYTLGGRRSLEVIWSNYPHTALNTWNA